MLYTFWSKCKHSDISILSPCGLLWVCFSSHWRHVTVSSGFASKSRLIYLQQKQLKVLKESNKTSTSVLVVWGIHKVTRKISTLQLVNKVLFILTYNEILFCDSEVYYLDSLKPICWPTCPSLSRYLTSVHSCTHTHISYMYICIEIL